MPTKTVLCSECRREKQLLDDSPNLRFVSCEPQGPGSKFCTLEYAYKFLPEGGTAEAPADPPSGD